MYIAWACFRNDTDFETFVPRHLTHVVTATQLSNAENFNSIYYVVEEFLPPKSITCAKQVGGAILITTFSDV